MRAALKFSLLFSGGWIAVKLIFYSLGVFQDNIFIPGMINNLFLLLAISLGILFEKKKEGYGKGGPLSDIKKGLTVTAPYVLIVAAFMYYYYDSINPSFIEHRIEQRMDNFYAEMDNNPDFIDSLREKNPKFKTSTKEDILKSIKVDLENNQSPFTMFVFSLLGLLIMGLTYSILITLIFQKILFRDYYKATGWKHKDTKRK